MILVAIVAGVGNLLASNEQLSWRIVVGRALSSGSLGMAAGAAYIVYPDIHPMALAGLSALVASVGTSGMERILQIVMGKR